MESKVIGLISDTHGILRDKAIQLLSGSDVIIHCGDIGNREVLSGLEKIAPVTAVRGNTDRGEWAENLPETQMFEVQGVWFFVIHDLNKLDLDPGAAGIDVVVSGHSHKPHERREKGVLYVNPGSAGNKRFNLPISLARMTITGHEISYVSLILQNHMIE